MTHRTITRTETIEGKATIGRAKTIHAATLEINYNTYGEIVSSRVITFACGSHALRRSGQARTPYMGTRHGVDCQKCLAQTETKTEDYAEKFARVFGL